MAKGQQKLRMLPQPLLINLAQAHVVLLSRCYSSLLKRPLIASLATSHHQNDELLYQ